MKWAIKYLDMENYKEKIISNIFNSLGLPLCGRRQMWILRLCGKGEGREAAIFPYVCYLFRKRQTVFRNLKADAEGKNYRI